MKFGRMLKILRLDGFIRYTRKNAKVTSTQKKFMAYTWWEITIFVIGLLSFISLVVVLFLPISKGPSAFTFTGDVPPVSSPSFATMLSESLNVPLRTGEPVTLVENGDAFLASLLKDIDSAHSSIDIMTYIWTKGDMSDQILEHLDQKAKEGVQVRLMIDSFGSLGKRPADQLGELKKLGGQVHMFHSLTFVPWNILRNQTRDHRRVFVIDGTVGYTGGITVSDPWLGDARNPKETRDMMIRVTGSMARDLQGMFGQIWASSTGEILSGDAFYPPLVAATAATNTYIPLASVPSLDSLALQKMIILSVLGAQKKIYITTPYFLPDQSFREALIKKAKEGVDVRILLPNKYNDVPSVRYASRYYYQELLQAGVKIYEYQPTFIHTKAITIDGTWSIVGSANMDNRSRKLNEEDVFGISDAAFAAQLEAMFTTDLKQSTEMNLADWKKRGLWERFREEFDRKLIEQY